MTHSELIYYLGGGDDEALFAKSAKIKADVVGAKTHLRGLIELSNVCQKECYYCGIRHSNKGVKRYQMAYDDIIAAADFAYENNFGSIAIQAGEQRSKQFTEFIFDVVKEIKNRHKLPLGITLSLGEQSKETYQKWRLAGAHRYLLRIETSSPELYSKLKPNDDNHLYNNRLECLKVLRECDYQVGSGVMIGLPGQTISDLANDLLFLKEIDVDMCGMGPYIKHSDAPLKDSKTPLNERIILTLRMIALLRIIMPNINIVSTTALQTLDKNGYKKGLDAGANIIMPNVTQAKYCKNYQIYDNKQYLDIINADFNVEWNGWGDSLHYKTNHVEI